MKFFGVRSCCNCYWWSIHVIFGIDVSHVVWISGCMLFLLRVWNGNKVWCLMMKFGFENGVNPSILMCFTVAYSPKCRFLAWFHSWDKCIRTETQKNPFSLWSASLAGIVLAGECHYEQLAGKYSAGEKPVNCLLCAKMRIFQWTCYFLPFFTCGM